MKYSEDNMSKFFTDLLASQKKIESRVVSVTDTTKSLLQIELKQAKSDAKEKKKEERSLKALMQLEKRKERNQRGPFEEMFPKVKRESTNMNLWLIAALGLGAGVLGAGWLMSDNETATKIREKVYEKVNELADKLKDEIADGIAEATEKVKQEIYKWAQSEEVRGSGLGDQTVPGEQEVNTEDAPGSIEDKMKSLKEDIEGGNVLDYITGADSERREQLYFLESGEVMSYAPDFQKGGSATSKGVRGIVSGDILRTRNEASVSKKDKKTLTKLDKLVRERRKINDNLAKAKSSDSRDKYAAAMRAKNEEINSILSDNEALVGEINKFRDDRISRINNPIRKQAGGHIRVPGYGDGDKVPMLLPEMSFVLNKKASKHFTKRQKGGPVYSEQHIMDYARSKGIRGKELASLMGQLAHESGDFRHATELDSGSRYEGSEILGNTQPGDGPKFKGRGYIQLTGRWNYDNYGKRLGLDLTNKPELAARPDVAAKIALMFWDDRVDKTAARRGDVRGTTVGINPGLKGLEDRTNKTLRYLKDPRMNNVGPKIVGDRKVGQKIVGTGNSTLDWVRGALGGPKVGEIIKKQEGGPIVVPGSGEGDKVPMLLPSGSFVLNKKASQKLQSGGIAGNKAIHDRFMNNTVSETTQRIPRRQVVVVKRSAASPIDMSSPAAEPSSSGGVNIVEMSDLLHRIQAGASY